MSRCTFKKQAGETGLRSIANPYPNTEIKLKGFMVGSISAPSRFGHDHWRVGIMSKQPITAEDPQQDGGGYISKAIIPMKQQREHGLSHTKNKFAQSMNFQIMAKIDATMDQSYRIGKQID